ncbi:MAG: hypothetical protein RLZZ136_875 [Pseudomonadota bacterium]|jgi:hypothetical protein
MKAIGLGLLGALTFTGSALAAPGDMNVSTFLGKADALKAKGMAAMFSSDLKVLMAEAKGAGLAYRAMLAQERAAGRPSSCPPEKAAINSDQLLTHLKAYPAAARQSITLRTAMADLFRKSFPCRK